MLGRPIALQLREAALVPELHGQPDNGVALLLQEGRDRRGIHPTAHSHSNQAALELRAGGQSVQLCSAAHALLILRENFVSCAVSPRPTMAKRLSKSGKLMAPYDRVTASFR